MRLVTKYEDLKTSERIEFLEDLVDSLRDEVARMRHQIDEARDIPSYIFETSNGEAEVYVMDDKRMAAEKKDRRFRDADEETS